MSYSSGLIFNDTNKYEINIRIVKAENPFSSNLPEQNILVNNTFSDNQILHWIISQTPFGGRLIQGENPRKEAKVIPRKRKKTRVEQFTDKKLKRKQKRGGKIKKWMLKLLKKMKKKERNKYGIKSKYMIPLILGLFIVKSLFILIALKALTFISAKGLMMGFFSTALASIVSLRSVFEHSHSYQHRMDDPKTQVEIIQVPSRNYEHIYYDDYYKRRDYMRMLS